jgi:hypothetical protein
MADAAAKARVREINPVGDNKWGRQPEAFHLDVPARHQTTQPVCRECQQLIPFIKKLSRGEALTGSRVQSPGLLDKGRIVCKASRNESMHDQLRGVVYDFLVRRNVHGANVNLKTANLKPELLGRTCLPKRTNSLAS